MMSWMASPWLFLAMGGLNDALTWLLHKLACTIVRTQLQLPCKVDGASWPAGLHARDRLYSRQECPVNMRMMTGASAIACQAAFALHTDLVLVYMMQILHTYKSLTVTIVQLEQASPQPWAHMHQAVCSQNLKTSRKCSNGRSSLQLMPGPGCTLTPASSVLT